eukprot:349738-Chlamydomonas_euryale.AAC.11
MQNASDAGCVGCVPTHCYTRANKPEKASREGMPGGKRSRLRPLPRRREPTHKRRAASNTAAVASSPGCCFYSPPGAKGTLRRCWACQCRPCRTAAAPAPHAVACLSWPPPGAAVRSSRQTGSCQEAASAEERAAAAAAAHALGRARAHVRAGAPVADRCNGLRPHPCCQLAWVGQQLPPPAGTSPRRRVSAPRAGAVAVRLARR